MYRRRRPQREKIAFGFDCFLDLVTNLIGIILRLILVAWVGGRAYHAAMESNAGDAGSGALAAPAPERRVKPAAPGEAEVPPHPLENEILVAQKDLAEARRHLFVFLDQVEASRSKTRFARAELDALGKERALLTSAARKEAAALAEEKKKTGLALASLDLLQRRSQELLAEIKTLEKAPAPVKLLRYRTPVSRVVDGEELMFECKAGRVSYIDVPAFVLEMRGALSETKLDDIAKLGSWTSTTAPIGAFRLRFTFEVHRPLTAAPGSFRIGLSQWLVEPVGLTRGETTEQALQAGSDFRRLIDGADPEHTTVTFWVYPDSFGLFRTLRDHLHAAGIEVAGRPLPEGVPITASPFGSKSRGQ